VFAPNETFGAPTHTLRWAASIVVGLLAGYRCLLGVL